MFQNPEDGLVGHMDNDVRSKLLGADLRGYLGKGRFAFTVP